MTPGDFLRKNLEFWHWHPRLICDGLTEEQLHWQPDDHPNHITFAIWHAYRCEDDVLHQLLIGSESIFATQGWADRLPVAEPGESSFGNGLDREQIAAVRLDLSTLLDYADAVGKAVQDYADSLTDETAAQELPLPWPQPVYPMLDTMSRFEIINFFSVGHVAEHLGEVQYIKGMLGLQGAVL